MSVDSYDVERWIRDAMIRLRSEFEREVLRMISELREELGAERVERQNADESMQRVLDDLTEGLS